MSSAYLPSSTILQNPQIPVICSLLHTTPLAITASYNFRFPPLARTFLVNTSKFRNFSSQSLYDTVSQPQPDDYDEDSAIGDCLVYEDGIFDDPFLHNALNSRNDVVSAPIRKSNSKDTTEVPPENLIPEKWLDVQREINISKKERRKLSQELEYGKSVEKRRQALMPLDSNSKSEAFERFKNEKLKQLKPLVLDEPKPPQPSEEVESDNKSEEMRGGDNERKSKEVVAGRVVPRNPRLAVYGGGLDDISAVFSSGDYDPGAAKKSLGTRKLFSKEEKSLLNRRVPDLAVAISGKWHPVHTLAASGEFYLVNSLLKHNIDINAPDKNGLTAIHKAILGRKQAIFNYLLRESANPFIRDNDGATLMHYAVFSASAQMIKILLLYNVNINQQAWYNSFFIQNFNLKHSWLLYFDTKLCKTDQWPLWWNHWWEIFGSSLEIIRTDVKDNFNIFKSHYTPTDKERCFSPLLLFSAKFYVPWVLSWTVETNFDRQPTLRRRFNIKWWNKYNPPPSVRKVNVLSWLQHNNNMVDKVLHRP